MLRSLYFVGLVSFVCLVTAAPTEWVHPVPTPTLPQEHHMCRKLVDPFTRKYVSTDCLPVGLFNTSGHGKRQATPPNSGNAPALTFNAPLPSLSAGDAVTNVKYGPTSKSNVQFIFSPACSTLPNPSYCNKIQLALERAGVIITNTFYLPAGVTVQVTVGDLCPLNKNNVHECADGQSFKLASAGPAMTIPLVSDDGTVRQYPQAVVKQFFAKSSNPPKINYANQDIEANINTNKVAFQNTWFPGDNLPPSDAAAFDDFTSTILHELVHGLGFTSSWNYYQSNNNNLFLPSLCQLNGNTLNCGLELATTDTVSDASEGIFDRFVTSKVGSTTVTRESFFYQMRKNIAKFPGSTLGAILTKDGMSATSSNFYQNQVTPLADTLNTAISGQSVILETDVPVSGGYSEGSNQAPVYTPGSTGSHVDYHTYYGKPDFLMVWTATHQGTMAQEIARSYSSYVNPNVQDQSFLNGVDLRQAIGPGLRSTLLSFGYTPRTASSPQVGAAGDAPSVVVSPPTKTTVYGSTNGSKRRAVSLSEA